jgi:hypothetical protein
MKLRIAKNQSAGAMPHARPSNKDLFAVQRKHHHRQRNQQARPKADVKRTPDQARIAGAERLRGKRCHGGHQSHSEGEADEEHRVRQRRRGDSLVPEASDQREIGGQHRDLPELRQRNRHRQLERLGQLEREAMAGRCLGDRPALDLVKGCHGGEISAETGRSEACPPSNRSDGCNVRPMVGTARRGAFAHPQRD